MIRVRNVLAIVLISTVAWGIGLPMPNVGRHVPPAEAASIEKCPVCAKTAYATESVSFNAHLYHKACFKCSTCGKTLTLNTVKTLRGNLYCAKDLPKK